MKTDLYRPAARLALTVVSLCPALLLCAKGTITGKALSKDNGVPIDFATVQLIDAKTGKPLPIGTTTDEQGFFTLPGVADGSYLVRVSSIGSIDNERPVTIAGADVNVGEIRLNDDSKLLQEVVVEGVRSQMRFELDRKVFQVDANVVAAGQSASELLESIPSVEVDQDGEVSLRGNSSVTVWINGKESGLTADNRAQILEQIPGETIDRIEVITNPSAKYSPEGTAGIINIILKQNRKAGYFGAAEIGGNSRGGGNASVNFNYNSSKWDTYASAGFRMRHNRGGSKSERSFTDSDEFLNSYGKSRNHGNNLFLRAGATYHITEKDDIFANAFGMFGHRWGHSDTYYTSNQKYHWSANTQFSRNRSDNRGAHAELGYTHKWNDHHTLDLLVGYNHWGGPQHRYYEEDTEYPSGSVLGQDHDNAVDSRIRIQDQDIRVNSVETKIDYVNRILPELKLEAGYQGNFSHENSPVTGQVSSGPVMTPAPSLYNTFIYQNNINALYFTLGGKTGNFSYSGGLRAEYWQVRTRSLDYYDLQVTVPAGTDRYDLVPLFKRDKFALFPSLFLSYSLPHDNEVQINYTRRIRRPWGGMLNSFVDISDPTQVSYGNPQLDPQYSDSFELNYIKSWTNHMISFSGYLRTSDDLMNRLSYLYQGVLYTTHANVAREVNSGAEIVVKNNLFRRLDLTTTFNLYNNHISSWETQIAPPSDMNVPGADLSDWGRVSGKSRNSFAWDVRCMASVRLPWQMSLQATGRYASKMLEAQGSRQGGWSVDAGVRKTFGDWSVSLNCRDIFDSRKFNSTVDGAGYTQYSERWRGGRTLSLTVKYSFGNMRAKPNRNQGEVQDGSGYGGDMD